MTMTDIIETHVTWESPSSRKPQFDDFDGCYMVLGWISVHQSFDGYIIMGIRNKFKQSYMMENKSQSGAP